MTPRPLIPEGPSGLSDRALLEEIYGMLKILTAPKKRRTPARAEYTEAFEKAWNDYPKRSGSNPKKPAFHAWNGRLQAAAFAQGTTPGNEAILMQEGVQRYRAWCEATGKTGSETVMQAQRFFGPSKEYQAGWEIAPQVIKLPRDLNELVRFAAERGISTIPGESEFEFRQRIEAKL